MELLDDLENLEVEVEEVTIFGLDTMLVVWFITTYVTQIVSQTMCVREFLSSKT